MALTYAQWQRKQSEDEYDSVAPEVRHLHESCTRPFLFIFFRFALPFFAARALASHSSHRFSPFWASSEFSQAEYTSFTCMLEPCIFLNFFSNSMYLRRLI